MKDNNNKKIISIVIIAIIILLICLLAVRSCDRDNKVEENDEIFDKNNKENDDDKTNDEVTYIEEVYYETSKPTIRLNGSETVYVEINSTYKEEGATAQDSKYGDLTDKIVIDNPLDITKLGTYVLTYTITNNDNETASVTRTVIVQDTIAPTIEYKEGADKEAVFVDANKNKEFSDHQVLIDDNSKNVILEMSVYYKDFQTENYTPVESMDISKVGYYLVYYTAVDESGNRSETLVVEYLVDDVVGPEITVSMNGTEYPVVDPKVVVEAIDANTTVSSFAYAWVTSLTETPSWIDITSGTTLTPPSNGKFYLMLKATDALGNESSMVTEAFEKDDTLMNVTNFNLHSGIDYKGVNAGIKVNKLTDINEISSVVVKLYSDDILLATNTSTDKIYDLTLSAGSIELSTPFIVVDGTYVEEYWTTIINSEYSISAIPTKVVFEVTKANGEVHTLENNLLVEADGIKWEQFFYSYDILVGNTRGDYQTVQEAVDNAADNAKILILPGTYDGAVTISKNLTIFGINRETTILTNTKTTAIVLKIVSASNVVIKNITVDGNGTVAGGMISNSKVTMDNNVITKVKNALYISGSSDVSISNSHISQVEGEADYGYIDADDTAKVTITNTTIVGSEDDDGDIGVYFYGDSTGSVVDSDLSNLNSAIGYENNQPTTSGNTYTNCTNEVVQID